LQGNWQVQFDEKRPSTQPYEYSDYNSSDKQSATFDRYTIPKDESELGQSRLLELDNTVVVPAKTHSRIVTFVMYFIVGLYLPQVLNLMLYLVI